VLIILKGGRTADINVSCAGGHTTGCTDAITTALAGASDGDTLIC